MPSAAAEHEAGSADRDSALMPIPLTTLCASTSLAVDVYLKSDEDAPPLLYREREYPMSHEDIERLVDRGTRVAYIPKQQVSDYQLVASDLFSILRHDYKTFTHSFNTASFCLLLAKHLGITGAKELKEIATGALLHDVGKLRIPSSILNKKSRLTDAEWQVIRQHPNDGFMLLCQRDDLSRGQLMMVYQHHERLDGQGYPVGESGDQIHYLARLCSVVDVFEAMSSHRPYRRAIPVPEVLEYLGTQADNALDKEMVRCWTEVTTQQLQCRIA